MLINLVQKLDDVWTLVFFVAQGHATARYCPMCVFSKSFSKVIQPRGTSGFNLGVFCNQCM